MSAIWSASSSTVIVDLVEPGVAAVDQVVQPAGGGHDHLGAGAQGVRLALQATARRRRWRSAARRRGRTGPARW